MGRKRGVIPDGPTAAQTLDLEAPVEPLPAEEESELSPTPLNTESLLVEARTELEEFELEFERVKKEAGSSLSADAREALKRYGVARQVVADRVGELEGKDATQIERDRLNTALEDLRAAFDEFSYLAGRR